jgi:carbon-monoxide dehydrogenase small subunit
LTLAVSVESRHITTVEGLTGPEADNIRRAFREHHALQCGFCTSGMLATALDILRRDRARDEQMVRQELAGNLCRCTGYQGIVSAILSVAEGMNR